MSFSSMTACVGELAFSAIYVRAVFIPGDYLILDFVVRNICCMQYSISTWLYFSK
jgi:hypothetical protein